jgi:hypothetical protein
MITPETTQRTEATLPKPIAQSSYHILLSSRYRYYPLAHSSFVISSHTTITHDVIGAANCSACVGISSARAQKALLGAGYDSRNDKNVHGRTPQF